MMYIKLTSLESPEDYFYNLYKHDFTIISFDRFMKIFKMATIQFPKNGAKDIKAVEDFCYKYDITLVFVDGNDISIKSPILIPAVLKIPGKNYSMGVAPVTQAQWESLMGNNPSYFKGERLPVENVSWFDVQEYIKALNSITGKAFRLPTSEEWEYAAKANQDTIYSGSNNIDEVAWYYKNADGKTHPVCQKAPNAFGLYDMSGNVWEWCKSEEYAKADRLRFLRGGSWRVGAENCRTAIRNNYLPDNRNDHYGFRLCKDI